jgi:regulator of replication initiation timing
MFFLNNFLSPNDTQLAQLKERMSGMEQEFESLNDDRMRLQNDNDDLKKRMQANNFLSPNIIETNILT